MTAPTTRQEPTTPEMVDWIETEEEEMLADTPEARASEREFIARVNAEFPEFAQPLPPE